MPAIAMPHHAGSLAACVLWVAAALGCQSDGADAHPAARTITTATLASTATATATPTLTATATAAPSASAAAASGTSDATATATPSDASASCPANMGLVEGNYCHWVQHPCIEEGRRGGKHCLRYAKSRCRSKKRRPMRFCMDRYEWPNEKGVKPRTLVSWPEARAYCASVGKRLCTEEEFNLACEGEELRPHVYGWERSKTACNADRPYIPRTYNYKRWDACMAHEDCRKEYERLDQRLPAGSKPECVNEHGIYDLNGNANEWVFRTDQEYPKRSGLKGGWWGPVRNRCRPMTVFHLEGDYGYEVGFRCCKDARDS
jgi:hypothetical protein